MANEFVIKNGYFSQGNSNVTGSLQVSGSIGVVGSGSDVLSVYGSQGNLLVATDTFSGSIFTVSDISGYPALDIISDYYTSSIYLPTLTSQPQQNLITYDSQSGRLYYIATSSVGGGEGGTSGSNATSSFTSSTTWTFTHNLNNRYPIIQTLDSNFNQIIPQNIELTDANTATITFPLAISGYAIASLGGSTITQINNTASSVFATTGSNTFRGDQIFSGSLIPAGPYTDNTSSYDLGSATAAWRDLYVSNGSIKMISGSNSASIQFNAGVVTFAGAAVILPSNSTVPTASVAATASTILVTNEPQPFIPQVRYLTYVYSIGNNQSLISTGSLQYNHLSNTIFATSSIAATASSVSTLNQNVIITGSVAIGTGSVGSGENNLLLGPAPAGGSGEGGQLGLLAAGGSYTSSSFIDNWQNQFRILRGPGASSNAGLMYMDLQTGDTQFVGAVTASAYSGLPNSWLHALRTSNQTIGSGTWASRDIVFDQVASNNFTYNSSTGIATLKAGKTYRLTARLAWSAAGSYILKFRVYNQTTSAFTGPTVEMIQSPNGTYNVSDNTLEHVLAVGASDIDISIRTTSDTNALTGEYIRGDLNTQLIIQQIA